MSTIGKRGWTREFARSDAYPQADGAEQLTDLSWRSMAFYFHQNAFTRDGDVYVFHARPDYASYHVDFFALVLPERSVVQLTEGMPGRYLGAVVAPGRRELIFSDWQNRLNALNLDTLQQRVLCQFPDGDTIYLPSVSCDEQCVATITFPRLLAPDARLDTPETLTRAYERYRAHPRRHSAIWLVPTEGGEPQCLFRTTDHWLGHIQFSPTDPELIMFCHEGPGEQLERMWTIRRDGTGLSCLLPRKGKERAGHEFFSADGRFVWFDLRQTDEYFELPGDYLACVNLDGSNLRGWKVPDGAWSVHYNRTLQPHYLVGDGYLESTAILGYRLHEHGQIEVERLCPFLGTYSPGNIPPNPEVQTDTEGRYAYFNQQVDDAVQIYRVPV